MNLFIVHIKLNRRVNFNGFEWVTEKNLESKPKSTLMKKVKNNDMRILKISLTFFLFYSIFFANEGNLSMLKEIMRRL